MYFSSYHLNTSKKLREKGAAQKQVTDSILEVHGQRGIIL